jgi:Uma2 family endonuclease
MAVAALVPVEEYLSSLFRPDRDYVDGEILERNVGELSHGRLQLRVAAWFLGREKQLGIRAAVEVRVRISPNRYRIPDITIISAGAPHEEVIVTAPALCIEILSPTDTLTQIWERTQDYLAISVPACWILDPISRRAWTVSSAGLSEATELLRHGNIEMMLADVFE